MWGLLAGLLWLVSFIMLPTKANGLWLPKDVAWLVGSWLLAASPWWNPPSRPSVRLPALGWLFSWLVLSFGWFVLWPQLTIPQAEVGVQRAVGMRWYVSPILPTLSWLGSFLALDALVRHSDSLVRWQRVALHLVRIGTVLAVWTVACTLGLNPLLADATLPGWIVPQALTTLGNASLTGNALAILAPLCLMFSARRYRWGAYGLHLLAILLSTSIMSLGTVWVASVVVWSVQRRWRWVVGAVVAAGLGALGAWCWLSPEAWAQALNPHGRWALWTHALTYWRAHPFNAWIGYGAGSVGAATANGIWDYGFLHNDYLQWGFEFGVIGLGLAGAVVLQAVPRLRRMDWTSASAGWVGAAVAYGLLMTTSFPQQIGSLRMVGIVIAAAVLAHSQPLGGVHGEREG